MQETPVELAKRYVDEGADELVFWILQQRTKPKNFAIGRKIAEEINIPFTVGGGISEISDVDNLKSRCR